MIHLVISGYHGFGNTGDEAILESFLQELRKTTGEMELAQQPEITVLSAAPNLTSSTYGVKAIPRTALLQIIKALRRSQALVSGGGGLLQDITGPFSVPYYLGICLLAWFCRRPFFLYAHGIGPLQKMVNRLLTRLVLNRAAGISVRDETSYQLLKQLGVRHPVRVSVDPAFALRPQMSERVKNILKQLPPNRPRFVICLRPWFSLTAQAIETIARGVDKFCHEKGAVALFLPFLPASDFPLALKTIGLMTTSGQVVEETLQPSEVLALIGEMDLVLSMRLHGLIFAFSAGIPLVALSYDPKIDYFMDSISQPQVIPVDKLTEAKLLDGLGQAWEQEEGRHQANKLQAEERRRLAQKATRELLVSLLEKQRLEMKRRSN